MGGGCQDRGDHASSGPLTPVPHGGTLSQLSYIPTIEALIESDMGVGCQVRGAMTVQAPDSCPVWRGALQAEHYPHD
jgi:hypothetical protein